MNLAQALGLRKGDRVVSNETSFEPAILTGGKEYLLSKDVTPLYVGRGSNLFSETPLRPEDKPVSAFITVRDDARKTFAVFYDRFELVRRAEGDKK
jgi:hypothetical protein